MKIKLNHEINRICDFIRNQVSSAHAKGVVLGISGGIDSAVTATLCRRALGAKRVTGVLMFEEGPNNAMDRKDAIFLTSKLGIRSVELNITPILNTIKDTLWSARLKVSRLTEANIKARIRMVNLYAIANEKNLLVAGTGDRSEILVGYYTKYGDGGVDFLPIGHLFKTEVRSLATIMRIPYEIVTKPSSPNLWPGQKAAEDLPADYDLLDRILTMLYDNNKSSQEIRNETGASQIVVNKVLKLNKTSTHKRLAPPTL